MRIFIAREVKAVIRRRGEKKLTLSVFSPVSRKYGPQRNSANAFWMYPTGVERRSFTIAFSSQSISVLCTFDEYFTTRNVALKAASFCTKMKFIKQLCEITSDLSLPTVPRIFLWRSLKNFHPFKKEGEIFFSAGQIKDWNLFLEILFHSIFSKEMLIFENVI